MLSFGAQAQKGLITGKVYDSTNRQPLADATVSLIVKEDSAGAGFAVTAKDGSFQLKNLPTGRFIIGISYIGFRELVKTVDISPAALTLDLGTIYLAADTGTLEGVIVTPPPITIKKDTVEFRAASFKTKPNASVEDLLKKLPGVEVDKEGKVTTQGEEVTKVYVDGKEFFSNDPKLATKNLTADLVESIQVFDDMSDQAKFTKIDDGSKQRTINIKLKKDKKKGYFGRATVAAGSDSRYSGNAAFNIFRDKRQVSVIGGANNVNRLGFTSGDAIGAMGGLGALQAGSAGRGRGASAVNGAPNGNTRSWNAGINFRDVWGPKIDVSGNYFVNNTSTTNRSTSARQNFFPNDSASTAREESFTRNSSVNHRFNARLEYAIDSMNSILITPSLNIQNGESLSYDTVSTTAKSIKTPEFLAITGNNKRTVDRDGWNLNNNLLFRHKFRTPGRTFTIGWTTAYNESNGEGTTIAPYTFFNRDGSVRSFNNRHQEYDQATSSFNNTVSASFTEALGINKVLELNYAYSNNQSTSDRKTYNFNALTGKFDSVNRALTNYFENGYEASRVGANFRFKKEKYDFQIGGGVQFASLENMSHRATTGKDSMMTQRYTNFFPTASFNFNPAKRKNLRFSYRGSTRSPSINQLQDVRDESNPLYIRTGNPDLDQEFSHNLNLNYNTFNMNNFVYFNANVSATSTSNKIVNSIQTVDSFVQLIRPVNVDGAYSVWANGTLGVPLKKVASGKRSPMNLNLSTTLRYSRDVSVLNKTTNYSHTRSASERIHFTYNIQDKLDVGASGSFTYNDARYTARPTSNYKYFNQTYSLDITYTLFKVVNINSDFDYTLNTGRADGFNQAIPLWNAGISSFLFKKKNAEIRFTVYDILNQNKSINRYIGDNSIEDTYTEVLQRFFMVSFMYNLNRFGGKRATQQAPQQRSMQGGRQFRN